MYEIMKKKIKPTRKAKRALSRIEKAINKQKESNQLDIRNEKSTIKSTQDRLEDNKHRLTGFKDDDENSVSGGFLKTDRDAYLHQTETDIEKDEKLLSEAEQRMDVFTQRFYKTIEFEKEIDENPSFLTNKREQEQTLNKFSGALETDQAIALKAGVKDFQTEANKSKAMQEELTIMEAERQKAETTAVVLQDDFKNGSADADLMNQINHLTHGNPTPDTVEVVTKSRATGSKTLATDTQVDEKVAITMDIGPTPMGPRFNKKKKGEE